METDQRSVRAAATGLDGCLDACRRCEAVLDCLDSLPPERARSVWPRLGPHLRHSLEHLRCLLLGLETEQVDYDARERDARLESDPRRFREALRSTAEALSRIDPHALARPLRVRQTVVPDRPAVTAHSSLSRELVFCAGHTVHHIAIMELLAREAGVSLPEGLSLAGSTAAYLAALRREPGPC